MFILCISHLGREERSWEATQFYQVILLINKLQPNTWPYYNAFGMENEAFCDSTTEIHMRFTELLHKNNTTMARATYNSPYFQLLYVLYTNVSWFQHLIFGQTSRQLLVKMLSILNGISVLCHWNSYILGVGASGGRVEGKRCNAINGKSCSGIVGRNHQVAKVLVSLVALQHESS